MSLGPVRRRSLNCGIYNRIVKGETPKEDSAKPASFFLQSRGFKSSFAGAPGEARVKERNSCGHSLYSLTFFLGLHNEQGKTQEKYHSKEICK